jgi:cobalt-zinc-cadmium efflux system protein
VATAHLVTAESASGAAVLGAASAMLRDRFHIAHATLQVEVSGSPQCQGADW